MYDQARCKSHAVGVISPTKVQGFETKIEAKGYVGRYYVVFPKFQGPLFHYVVMLSWTFISKPYYNLHVSYIGMPSYGR